MADESTHAVVGRAVLPANDPRDGAPLVTVIVPVYNEAETISELLARVVSSPYSKQVIVVDDGSTDGTADALRVWQDDAQIRILRHDINRGAGAAIRTALPHARGRFTIIQDADLEYDPQDYPRLIEPLLAEKARAVFGSRYMPETPPEPLWKRVVSAVRTMKSAMRNALQSLARGVKSFFAWWAMLPKRLASPSRATDANANAAQAAGQKMHHGQAAAAPDDPAKRRLPGWGPRRLGAAVLKLAARQLYRARLSDVAASLKAFSTDLLRKLDLQCERFEFGPEVAAKLCRTGEKIVEVPIRYEHRVPHRSRIIERFSRRPEAIDDRELGRRRAAKKHRWNDGLHALDTLWNWRYWAPQVPDPNRIPAEALAASAAYTRMTPAAGEVVSSALGTDIDHWADEDSKHSDFDEAVWNDPARPRPTDESVGGMVEKVLAASAEVRERRANVAAAIAAAAANFEPRLMWELFVRKPSSRIDDDSDDKVTGEDWEHWGLTDLLLLLGIVNIGLLLLVTTVAPFSSWSGLMLAVLASAITFRTTRAGKFKFDKCNQAFAVLTALLVCTMFPSSWVWRDRTMLILAGLALLVGLGRLRSNRGRRPERSLLDAVGVLALFIAGLNTASPDQRIGELMVLLGSVAMFLAVQQRRPMPRPSDNTLLSLTAIGTFLVAVFWYLFPVNLWKVPWWETWLRFKYRVLPHWTDYWWFRWSIVLALAAIIVALLMHRARKSEA